MPRVMIFIDGTWLYSNRETLRREVGDPGYDIDYGLLPRTLAEEVGRQLGGAEMDVVRTCLFGSYAENFDARDQDAVDRRLDFFAMLKEEYHYEVETFPINYRGRRLSRRDREAGDDFEPKEKCVDLALAASMLYYAAIPLAFDVAIAVIGDQDYKPVLQHLRRLAKRVAIASIRGSCAYDYTDPEDKARVRDFDPLFLNDMLDRIRLKYEPQRLQCASRDHIGDRWVWTTYRPRKGRPFYCDKCRERFAAQRVGAEVAVGAAERNNGEEGQPATLLKGHGSGAIKRLFRDKGYGFIRTGEGRDLFFHQTGLQAVAFETLREGLAVEFDIETGWRGERAVNVVVRPGDEEGLPAAPAPVAEEPTPLE